MSLDANQIIRKCFDSTKNALRMVGAAGSLSGQITWDTGLGAIEHILGPSDEDLAINAARGNDLDLGVDGTWVLSLYGTEATVTAGNNQNYNLNAIAGGAAVTLTVSINGGAAETITFASTDPLITNFAAVTAAQAAAVINDQASEFTADVSGTKVRITSIWQGVSYTLQVTGGTANNAVNGFNFSTSTVYGTSPAIFIDSVTVGDDLNLGEDIVFANAVPHSITGVVNQNLALSTSGTGHLTLGTTGGTVTLNDDGSGITVTAAANATASLSTSGTGHATVSAVGGTITINDDGAGITVTAAANCTAALSTSGTGHATVGTANNTLTVYDDAATGIEVSGHLHVGGLFVTDAAQIIETIVMQAGAAHAITVAATDHFIGVDCSAAGKAVNLPAAATAGAGRVLIIKDQSGNAGANNITITPNGAEKIDEAATHVISSNYGSVTLVCTGTAGNEWAVV
jgi:hypothetical protein